MSNIVIRALTGAVFVVVMLYCATNHFLWLLLCATVNIFCIKEFHDMFHLNKNLKIFWMIFSTAIIISSSFMFTTFISEVPNISMLYKILIAIVFVLGFVNSFIKTDEEKIYLQYLKSVFCVLYISVPLILLYIFSFEKTGENMFFTPRKIYSLLILTWTNDTFAYLTGKYFGKHKLVPTISPGKTIEGLCGGIFFSFLAGGILSEFFFSELKISYIVWGGVVSISATLGDLTESVLKRKAGVKDSGNILPGHGGMLDRFDATLFTAPISYLFWM